SFTQHVHSLDLPSFPTRRSSDLWLEIKMQQTFEISLIESFSIAPNTLHLRFHYLGDETFQFKAGQFISLHLESDGKIHRRNFSIANKPSDKQEIDFAA